MFTAYARATSIGCLLLPPLRWRSFLLHILLFYFDSCVHVCVCVYSRWAPSIHCTRVHSIYIKVYISRCSGGIIYIICSVVVVRVCECDCEWTDGFCEERAMDARLTFKWIYLSHTENGSDIYLLWHHDERTHTRIHLREVSPRPNYRNMTIYYCVYESITHSHRSGIRMG